MRQKIYNTLTCAVILFPVAGYTAELYFPPELLSVGEQQVADLSHFQGKGHQPPGEYNVDIYLNQSFVEAKTVSFVSRTAEAGEVMNKEHPHDDATGLIACLTRNDLLLLGVKMSDIPGAAVTANSTCLNPEELIPGAFSRFDFTRMRLDISIPQAALNTPARGYIDPELWDEGINAALLNYQFSGSHHNASGNGSSENYYLNLTSGVNAGAWRLRDYRIWNYYKNNYSSRQQWQRVKTYVERSIIPLRSALTLGESSTSSDIFDSLSFRGIQLNTEDAMYPDTRRGYAPTIRGVAESNAQVSIRQNGYNVYQTTVAPGAFEISDLYPMYSSGDLEVSVREASGVVRSFTVPYSSVPLLQRQGRVKYSLTAGRYQNSSVMYDSPSFAEATLLWGLPANITAYGGMQYSENYLSAQLGSGFSAGSLGAVSVDVTHADSTLTDGSKHQGQSFRFLYGHSLNATGTTVRLTGYRYSTKGFHTLGETALNRMSGRLYEQDIYDETGELIRDTYTDYVSLYNTKRARIEANISQSLGQLGAMYVTGVRQTFWGTSDTTNSLQGGFSSSISAVNYSLSYGYNRYTRTNGPSYNERTMNLSLSVPLGALLSPGSKASSLHATYTANRDNQGNMSHQAGLSGTALEQNTLSWNLSQGHARNQGYTGNTGVSYKGGSGNVNASYSYGSDYKKIAYGFSGSTLLHGDGITLGQPVYGTAVLVAAPGAADISLKNERGVRTDRKGYAIKPFASSYRENRVSLDLSQLDDKTEIDNTVFRVTPTKGAIVKAGFNVHKGEKLLVTAIYKGRPVPFGSVAAYGNITGIVGDEGQVFMTGMPGSGKITFRWGDKDNQHCTLRYKISAADNTQPITRVTGDCR